MTGSDVSLPQTIPFVPAYIPEDVDMTAVKAQVAATGVSAPPAAMSGLLMVVQRAHDEGIDLKIVLLDHNPPTDTPLRDIATVVGADYRDVTVLALSPNYVGSYSTQFPRVTLEAGRTIQDRQPGAVGAEFCERAEHPGVSLERADHFLADRRARGGRRHPDHGAAQ